VGPYSPACDFDAPLVAVSAVEELEREDVRGAIVLFHGQIVSGQVMPRNFRFYNPEEHQRIYRALDAFGPAAVVAATGRDPSMVGSQYPFPLFEDGDLDISNAYLQDTDGERLLAYAGQRVRLRLESRRMPAVGEHVVARLAGSGEGRVVLTAHIDSRRGSPGGLDNGSGVATLLGVAKLLADAPTHHGVEIVPFNGEDDYANPGELLWIEENEGHFGDIVLGINVDDSSQRGTLNHVSFYDCPPEIEVVVRQAMERSAHIEAGPQWYQGDHMILGMYGRPAVAIASSEMAEFMALYAHSERDVPELADPALMAETARFIAEVVQGLD
jgi:aminopeptidase YwaD